MFNNFCRAHQTLSKAANGIKTTPAMAAGVSDHVWEIGEIVDVLETWERRQSVKRAMASEGWHT